MDSPGNAGILLLLGLAFGLGVWLGSRRSDCTGERRRACNAVVLLESEVDRSRWMLGYCKAFVPHGDWVKLEWKAEQAMKRKDAP